MTDIDVAVLRLALQDAENRMEEREDRIGELYKEIEDIEAETYGLQMAIARHAPGDSKPDHPAKPSLASMQRTDAILAVLGDAEEPMTPKMMVATLTAAGRVEKYDDISSTMIYLKKKNRIHKTGRGLYMAGPMPRTDRMAGDSERTLEEKSRRGIHVQPGALQQTIVQNDESPA